MVTLSPISWWCVISRLGGDYLSYSFVSRASSWLAHIPGDAARTESARIPLVMLAQPLLTVRTPGMDRMMRVDDNAVNKEMTALSICRYDPL
jgi:hypothetical protein